MIAKMQNIIAKTGEMSHQTMLVAMIIIMLIMAEMVKGMMRMSFCCSVGFIAS